ncbi:hypothetical protein ACFQDG_06995 [Natronoarchaeum mannanilyticum]|uniref:DUF7282 domain-containing protein n=1 Tax=Natronoarchaeum mannanilyticum TaxID=926360 RepID=A0AAV3T730_9EURY
MRQLDRQTISALFVALALVLAIGPAMGLAGASVQANDDGAETADGGAQTAIENHTTDGTTNHTVETRLTADRITIDRISTDYLTIENLTIEGLNVTSTAVGAMFGASPGDMEGVTVEDGMDNETENGLDNETDDGVEDDLDNESDDGLNETDDEEEDAQPEASVTFEDQETDGSTVTVDSVNVSEGGFVTIHDSSLLEGATFDSVVGSSEYLEPGEHEDVEVQLYDEETVPGAEFDQDALEDNQTLIAMPHLDTNGNESYDFLETDGEEDGPYTEDGEAVVDDAEITVVDDEEMDNETDDGAMDNATDDDAEEMDNETGMAGDAPVPEGDSYEVSTLEAPENATVGDQLTVTAEISNPNDFETNQSVEFRLDGDVVERQFLVLDGGENETVTFEIDTEGLEAGDYNHGVLTYDCGEVADISLEEADEEEDDEEEAPADDGEDEEDEEDAEPNATVTFEDQETDGSTVTVQNVNVSEGGFVTIHDSSLLEGATFDSVVGSSEYLEPGEHEDVEVQLYDEETVPGAEFDQDALEDNQTLIAMPHLDTNDNESYDFLETDGEEDGPYTEDGEAVVDDAEITVVDEEADGEDDAPVDEEEEDDGETNATLDVEDQSGDGTTLEIGQATAGEDFYVVANYDGETSESPTFNAVEERLDYTLTLDPAIESDTTVEVAILSAEDDEELTSQEIEYDVEEEDDEAEAPTDDGEDDEEEAPTEAAVTFEDQETDGSTVTVDSVSLPDGGFVTIHDSSLFDEVVVDSVVGTSEYLEPGEHEDVEVQLYDEEMVPGAEFDQDALEEDQTLIAMPHQDTNDNETYDFVETDGEEDGPYTEDDVPIIDDAGVTVTDGDADAMDDDETDGETNETDGTTNETDGDATGVDGNETAALFA